MTSLLYALIALAWSLYFISWLTNPAVPAVLIALAALNCLMYWFIAGAHAIRSR